MAGVTRANPYYRPLYDVFRQLVVLNGVLFQLTHHLKSRTVDVEALLKKYPRRGLLFAGAALIIMDLTEVQPDGYPVVFPVGSHTRTGRRYQTMLKDIAAREAAWSVAQGFEAFERFCKETSALFLKRNPALLTGQDWRPSRGKQSAPPSARLADIRAFVERAYRGAEDLQRRLSRSLPRLTSAELVNHRGINLSHWLVATATVRHATVHNGRVITPKQVAKCGPEQFKVLRQMFPGRMTTVGYSLALDEAAASKAIEMLAEYAFLIYREATTHDGLDPAVYKEKRIRV